MTRPACTGALNFTIAADLDKPDTITAIRDALQTCETCPMRACRAEMADLDEPTLEGVWNGVYYGPHGRLFNNFRHGTAYGFRTHRKRGETPCQPCRAAAAKEMADRTERIKRARELRGGLCVNGHEMTEANTFVDNRGKRGCRICRSDSQAAWRERRRAS